MGKIKKRALPQSALGVASAKAETSKTYSNRVVPISGTDSELYIKDDGTVVVRQTGAKTPKAISSRRGALEFICSGLSGEDFKECKAVALGTEAVDTLKRLWKGVKDESITKTDAQSQMSDLMTDAIKKKFGIA